jgi:hypothetical protein
MDPFFKMLKTGREEMLIQRIARVFRRYPPILPYYLIDSMG